MMTLILAGLFSSLVQATTLQFDGRDAINLQNSLEHTFPSLGYWSARCVTEWQAEYLSCSGDRCQVVGLDRDGTNVHLTADAKELAQALRQVLPKTTNDVRMIDVSCVTTMTGFANCGTGRDETLCSAAAVVTR